MSYREVFVMADKNTLRLCEFLLERSPREVARPARNPMWTFLKGIEGFNTTRAAECLGLLLDAQYASISDLKRATSQDLIEDAGLRPEDAVEIVYAAKDAVVHVDCPTVPAKSAPTDFALPWANESYQPFVNPQSYVKTW